MSKEFLSLPLILAVSFLLLASISIKAETETAKTKGTVNGIEKEAPPSIGEEKIPSVGGTFPPEWLHPPKPPFGVSINNGAKYTCFRTVTLDLTSGPDTERMAVSNFPDFRYAVQEPYRPTKKWDLCKGITSCSDGKYTVYVKFYTRWGRASEVVSDSIIYRKRSIVD